MAPVTRGRNRSGTERSNAGVVSPTMTSPGASPGRRAISSSRLTTPACSTITPLGRPVDPEV